MEILTQAVYDRHCEVAIAANGRRMLELNGIDEEMRFRDRFGISWERSVELRPGLELMLVQYRSNCGLGIRKVHPLDKALTSTFRLSGQFCTLTPGLLKWEETLEVGGHHYLAYMPDTTQIEQWFGDNDYWDFLIFVDLSILRQYCVGFEPLPNCLRTMLEQEMPPRFFQEVGTITPQMLALLQQLWIAPFQPPMQRMYLESCVLHLLALQLNQWSRIEQGIDCVKQLTFTEIERIYQARDLLIRQHNHPPSPLILAQQVELSERKLQKGFREIFDTTVFGYLHDYRMEQAKLLLCDRATSVATVANIVGYSHLGYFAAAFKRKFGMSPKAWQQGKKGSS
jgi:AraC family transcriptional regulator, transcriptional activator of the genes for pyochelin and ferripyochelin receptors